MGNTPLNMPIWAWLTRRAGVLAVTWGVNGKALGKPRQLKATLPDEVMVGLLVAQNTDQPCQAVFEEYSVKVHAKE